MASEGGSQLRVLIGRKAKKGSAPHLRVGRRFLLSTRRCARQVRRSALPRAEKDSGFAESGVSSAAGSRTDRAVHKRTDGMALNAKDLRTFEVGSRRRDDQRPVPAIC